MDLKEKISRVMKQSISDSEVMGVNLLVEKDGRELIYCEEGLADREAHKSIRRDTIFRLVPDKTDNSGLRNDINGERASGPGNPCFRISACVF